MKNPRIHKGYADYAGSPKWSVTRGRAYALIQSWLHSLHTSNKIKDFFCRRSCFTRESDVFRSFAKRRCCYLFATWRE